MKTLQNGRHDINILGWYKQIVVKSGRADYSARQQVHDHYRQEFGEARACQMAREISGKLDRIETRVTGRDCRADWRMITD